MANNLHELPIDEKLQIVEDLWDSIAEDQNALTLTDEQRSELNQRLDAYETDGIRGRSADEVIAHIRKRL